MKAIVREWATDIRPTKEEVMELCKPGEMDNSCIWLMVDAEGMYCAFYNRPYSLVKRLEEGDTNAKRDGCDKVRELPWPQSPSIVIF